MVQSSSPPHLSPSRFRTTLLLHALNSPLTVLLSLHGHIVGLSFLIPSLLGIAFFSPPIVSLLSTKRSSKHSSSSSSSSNDSIIDPNIRAALDTLLATSFGPLILLDYLLLLYGDDEYESDGQDGESSWFAAAVFVSFTLDHVAL